MLDPKKVKQSPDIPIKLLKGFSGVISDDLYDNMNKCITNGEYIDDFKKASVCPI